MDTLLEHGEQLSRDALQKNPAKILTLMNAACNMSSSSRALEKRKSLQIQDPAPSIPNASTPPIQ
jgi:hypothetical protein